MSSVNWKKIKTASEAKAMLRHCDNEQRLVHEHANAQIDKTNTYRTLKFGAAKDGYKAICDLYDAKLEALDSQPGANKRKDRVTCIGWSIPLPRSLFGGLDDEGINEMNSWFEKVYETIEVNYGDCLLGGYVHYDELHDYKDAETGEQTHSLPHLHVYVIPEVDDKLKAKEFTAKKNMIAMNTAIEDMTQTYFPGHTFQTGKKRKRSRSVEELKVDSQRLEIVEQAQKEAQKIREKAQKEAEAETEELLRNAEIEKKKIIEEAEKEADRRLEAVKQRESKVVRDESNLQSTRHWIEDDKAKLDTRKKQLDALEAQLSEREALTKSYDELETQYAELKTQHSDLDLFMKAKSAFQKIGQDFKTHFIQWVRSITKQEIAPTPVVPEPKPPVFKERRLPNIDIKDNDDSDYSLSL